MEKIVLPDLKQKKKNREDDTDVPINVISHEKDPKD